MSTDKQSSPKAPPSEAKPGKKAKEAPKSSAGPSAAPNQVPELDETKIDAPSRQELLMLGIICVTTLILWAAGRAACNYQVPGESLTPRKVTLEERTLSSKDVGIEFAQALGGGDFTTAASLARAEGAALVKKEKAQCGECAARKKAAKKLLSVATVLKANLSDAIVSVKTTGSGSGDTVRVLGIEREGRKWFVTRVYASAAEAQLKEPPASALAPPGIAAPEGEGAPLLPVTPEAASSSTPAAQPSPSSAPVPSSPPSPSSAPVPSSPPGGPPPSARGPAVSP